MHMLDYCLYAYRSHDKPNIYRFSDTLPCVLSILLIMGFCYRSWLYLNVVYLKAVLLFRQFDEKLHLTFLDQSK